jgi:DnaJ-class molecular chaperone
MSDETVPLQEFVDEHNRLLEQLEEKKQEINNMGAKFEEIEQLYIDSEEKLKDMLDACAEQRDAATNDIEHLLDQLEVKEREIEQYKEMFEQSYGLNKSRNVRIGELLAENGRLREVLKWIVEHSVDYQAIIKARQALKGGRECPECLGTGFDKGDVNMLTCQFCNGSGKDGDS